MIGLSRSRRLAVILAAASFASCVPLNTKLQRASAGEIGCPPEEIAIADFQRGGGTGTWTAACRGRTYVCSAVDGGEAVQISCTEDAPSSGGEIPFSAPTEPAGCAYDTQCKGDRICEDGRCVSPTPAESAK
jgi:hypothetical protein